MGEIADTQIVKKVVQVPLYSNKSVVVRGAGTTSGQAYEKIYRLHCPADILSNPFHADAFGLQSSTPVKGVHKLQNLRSLDVPHVLDTGKSDEQTQQDFLSLITQDKLKFLSLELQKESEYATKVLQQLKTLKNLQRIHLTIKAEDALVLLLNQSLTRESQIKHVDVCFDVSSVGEGSERERAQASVQDFEIKFPRYMKHLRSLCLWNICDKNFTETLFDMAAQSRLRSLSLSLAHEGKSLPNFSEALAGFTALQHLHLSRVFYAKIDQSIFLDFVIQGLKVLSLDQINFTDQQFKEFLERINESRALIELKLQQVPLDTDFKLNLFNGFLAGNKKLRKVTLSQNMLSDLEILSQIFINKTMKQLCLTEQSYTKSS